MSTEKYTIQPSVCTSLCTILSQQNCIMALCLIATYVLSLKCHMPLDSGANDMLMRAECSCHLVVGFLVGSERSVLGESQGVGAISSSPNPHPSLILLAAACLNGQNPWTDWYIGARCRRCEETPFACAVTAITLPSFLLSILPSPSAAEVTGHKSLQTWEWGVLRVGGG